MSQLRHRQDVHVLDQRPHIVTVDLAVLLDPEVGHVGQADAALDALDEVDDRLLALAADQHVHAFVGDDLFGGDGRMRPARDHRHARRRPCAGSPGRSPIRCCGRRRRPGPACTRRGRGDRRPLPRGPARKVMSRSRQSWPSRSRVPASELSPTWGERARAIFGYMKSIFMSCDDGLVAFMEV